MLRTGLFNSITGLEDILNLMKKYLPNKKIQLFGVVKCGLDLNFSNDIYILKQIKLLF